MDKLFGIKLIVFSFLLSFNLFANSLTFDFEGKTYVVANKDEQGSYSWFTAKSKCEEKSYIKKWFVPSKEQLEAMHEAIDERNFSKDSYWSSSEFSTDLAWFYNFHAVTTYFQGKNTFTKVRCVRILN
jgi:hypothetical protein